MLSSWKNGPIVTDTIINHLTQNRSIVDLKSFTQPKWPDGLHDPFLLPDMKIAIERIHEAITKKQKIGIVGDYDMDGTPGVALLSEFFALFSNEAHVILPTRTEGYGFSTSFVDRFERSGVEVVLTVDCGIRDFDAIALAKEKDIDVIIIDHHECPEPLPRALAIINPKRKDSTYPFSHLCGTGVAFKVLQAYFDQYEQNLPKEVTKNWLAWSLDLVGLATLGDMVPLVDENRLFAFYGRKVIQRGSRLGLLRLLESSNLAPFELSYNDITFKLISKCNASGRMESMDDVLTLLTSRSTTQCDEAIKHILTRDTQRQLVSKTMYEHARQRIDPNSLPSILVLYDKNWHPGVTGLLASRINEEYQRPTIVLGTLSGTEYRGSMRAHNGFDVPEVLGKAGTLLERFGGHSEAAGLTVKAERLEDFKHAMESVKISTSPQVELTTDGTINANQAELSELARLEQMAPWGLGNEEPMWSLAQIQLQDVRWLGEKRNHLKAIIPSRPILDVIGFSCDTYRDFDFSKPVDILGTLSINRFRGKSTPQLQLKGLRKYNG